ncbi:MAG: hypothetical protein AAFZ07_26585 [Actinomycetota bacterium]
MSAADPDGRLVRVLPDEPAIDRVFDYLVPADAEVHVGDVVRIALGPRRVGGWIVEVDAEPTPGVVARPVAKISGRGPTADLIELARWAAIRWVGRPAMFLRTADAPRRVQHIPAPRLTVEPTGEPISSAIVRVPPAVPRISEVLRTVAAGPTLVVVPAQRDVDVLVARLAREGLTTARWPDDWTRAAGGVDVTVGTRAACWARIDRLAAIVLIDEHDESLRSEAQPTWTAREVLVERARRSGVPLVATSPAPSLEALDELPLVTPARLDERNGWPTVEVVDRRADAPGPGSLYSERLVEIVRSEARVVCVLNRKGRAGLLRCRSCHTTATCERCGAAVEQPDADLVCRRCGEQRPTICLACGSTGMVRLRPGVSRVAEELAALARAEVVEVTGDGEAPSGDARIVVGTEAVLHRVRTADVVVLLDVDQELLAPRFRAAEQALWLLARAARLVGGRARGGRIVVQTRLPDHEVLDAAVHADPARLVEVELARRRVLELPPVVALAQISGAGAAQLVASLGPDVAIVGPDADGAFLVRAADPMTLGAAISAAPRPADRVRVEISPWRS